MPLINQPLFRAEQCGPSHQPHLIRRRQGIPSCSRLFSTGNRSAVPGLFADYRGSLSSVAPIIARSSRFVKMAVVAEPGNLVLTRVTQATVVPAKAGIQEIPRKRASRNDGFMMRLPGCRRAGIGAKSPKLTTPLILSLSKDGPKEEPPDRERWFDKLTMSGYLLP